MKATSTRGLVTAALAFAAALVGSPAAAQEATAGDWKFRAQIYGWFPTLASESTFSDPNGGGSTSLDAGDYLDALRFVFMGTFEARKGRLGLLTDYIYLDFDAEKGGSRDLSFSGPLGLITLPADASADVNLRLRGWAWGLAGTYALVEKPGYEMQLVGGVRLLKIDTTLDWSLRGNVASLPQFTRTSAYTSKESVWDAIVGAKGALRFGDGNRWFAPYYVDIGTGQSDLTWQAMGGVGYAFSWGEVLGAYRHLDYKFGQDTGLKSISFSGPAIAVGFRW